MPVLALFSLAALASSFLMFWAEPLFARLVLPLLGGSPAVWNTCLMYFQALLLFGYLYAHAITKYLRPRTQALVHGFVLAVCIFALPLAIPAGWSPPAAGNVVPWLLLALTASVGAPFFALSATAPLLQRWYTLVAKPDRNPYILYAASNAGSFLGLLAFPLLLEPRLRLGQQSQAWTAVYLVAFAIVATCAMAVWRRSAKSPVLEPETYSEESDPTWPLRLKWIALAFVPSSLLLGVTTFLSTDVAATPLLWVIPLALYLLTFVIVFGRGANAVLRPAAWIHAGLATALGLVFFWQASIGFRWSYALHLSLFAFTALVLHGELSKSRPSPRYLTSFYLWMSLGGALGGAFAAIVVPLVFRSTRDYLMMLVIACFLRPSWRKLDQPWQVLLGVVPAMILVFIAKPQFETIYFLGISLMQITSIVVILIALALSRNALRFGTAIALVEITGLLFQNERGTMFRDRSFFGIYRVVRSAGPATVLFHGSTIHGAQLTTDTLRRMPVTYYHPNGPVGQVFKSLQSDIPARNVGVVGLGSGSILCYSKPGESWTFFEIDPHVEAIARNPQLFTFLSQCAVRPRIVIGDARLTLGHERAGSLALLVLDAFSSDAIPVHLLTREALSVYSRVLNDHGLLLVHISNRRLDLEPVVGTITRDAGFFALIRNHDADDDDDNKTFEYGSDWVIVARNISDLAPLARDKRWRSLRTSSSAHWTDDYSNIFNVIKW